MTLKDLIGKLEKLRAKYGDDHAVYTAGFDESGLEPVAVFVDKDGLITLDFESKHPNWSWLKKV